MAVSRAIVMANLIPLGSVDGGAVHQQALAARFHAAGRRVVMLSPAPRGTRGGALPGQVATPSTRALGLPGIFDALWQLPAIAGLRLRGYGTLYVRANALTVLEVGLARLLGMHVVVEHNGWLASERLARGGAGWAARCEAWLQVASARLAQRSRCVTAGIAALLVARGCPPARLAVIGNGVDVETLRPLRAPRRGAGPLRLGFLGLLNAWQGLETALEALALLPPGTCTLDITGDGPQRAVLEARAQDLGLVDVVRFHGAVAHDRACAVINDCDVAIAPYTARRNAEIGLSPIKIRDYAACGRAVVAAELPGIDEHATEGWLFTHVPDDAADLARILTRMASLDDAALAAAGVRARRIAEERFDWRRLADEVLALC